MGDFLKLVGFSPKIYRVFPLFSQNPFWGKHPLFKHQKNTLQKNDHLSHLAKVGNEIIIDSKMPLLGDMLVTRKGIINKGTYIYHSYTIYLYIYTAENHCIFLHPPKKDITEITITCVKFKSRNKFYLSTIYLKKVLRCAFDSSMGPFTKAPALTLSLGPPNHAEE